MRSAIAVFHNTSKSANPRPVPNASTTTIATGAAAPNTTRRAGHPASTSNAARIG